MLEFSSLVFLNGFQVTERDGLAIHELVGFADFFAIPVEVQQDTPDSRLAGFRDISSRWPAVETAHLPEMPTRAKAAHR